MRDGTVIYCYSIYSNTVCHGMRPLLQLPQMVCMPSGRSGGRDEDHFHNI